MPNEAHAVSFSEVSFAYNGVSVLEDVSFSVAQRGVTCIVGPNGGGKTTLLKIMLGLLAPHSGEVRVLGQSPRLARRRVGYMPQYAHHDPKFPTTVMDVALMGRLGRQWGGYSRSDKDAARAALRDVGVDEFRRRPFSDLSGGQRQRVLIARALACEPELLLLDEPTANIDAAVEAKLLEYLRELGKRMTIMIVSHDLGFVSNYVDSVLCVSRKVAVHPTSEITGEIIQEMYGEGLRMVRHDHRCSAEGHTHG
jgi:zinc transport system ATP-binding protein